MRILAGTSGFSFDEWVGPFYPEDLPSNQRLRYYATRLSTVEINNTFYRLPTRDLLEKWGAEVPEGFVFALKASQRITHLKRLRDVAEPLDLLLTAVRGLGAKLGPILFGLPPNMKKDLPRLVDFLALLPGDVRAAFEFRHASWLSDDVFDALRTRGAALCVAEVDEGEGPTVPLVATTDWGYLRLRRADYDQRALTSWASRLADQPFRDVFVYFKHEDAARGTTLARAFASVTAAS